jgi:hypothetical protein
MHVSVGALLLVVYLLELRQPVAHVHAQNSRTSDRQSCERLGAPKVQGAPVGCSWNVDVLERSYFDHECEPSQSWLDIAASDETATEGDEFLTGAFACSGRSVGVSFCDRRSVCSRRCTADILLVALLRFAEDCLVCLLVRLFVCLPGCLFVFCLCVCLFVCIVYLDVCCLSRLFV